MEPVEALPARQRPSRAPGAAKARIVAAALDLFAHHGVGGTSLGMIAKSLGVTKAAIYHQFPTKREIVLAAAEAELTRLEAVLAVAEAQPSRDEAREVLVESIVELAIESRHTMTSILTDPVVNGFFAEHDRFRAVMGDLSRLLMGDQTGAEARVQVAVLVAAISGAVMHPLVVDLDDDTLRSVLLQQVRRSFGFPT